MFAIVCADFDWRKWS